jgi:hypothetical protein
MVLSTQADAGNADTVNVVTVAIAASAASIFLGLLILGYLRLIVYI